MYYFKWGLIIGALMTGASLADETAIETNKAPLWELGLGAGAISIPHYRGARDNQEIPFPFVYPVYRGKFLQVDEDGIQGLLLDSNRFHIDISADGTVPAGSDVEIREGMPDLDLTFQLGPSFEYRLWQDDDPDQRLFVRLPIRAVFAVDSGIDTIGYTTSPNLTYYRRFLTSGRSWRLGLSGGLEFGSGAYHDYFYTVDPQFSRPGRPAFDASSGYAGTRFTLSLQSRSRRNWGAVFVRYDNVSDAVFEDSPLVERTENFTVGVVFTWFVARSKKMVEISDRKLNY